jgi:hypothetical protein
MPAPHLTHELVCVGTHDQHDFHANNARAFHDLLTGGLGPQRILATNLSGPRVSVASVESALDAAVDRAAPNLIFYFSGHGNAAGLSVTNGAISPEMFERQFLRTSASSILVILDLAIGADPDRALLPDWLRRLVASRTGIRAAVARATRIGAGAENEGLGRFTAALISALDSAPSDLRFENTRFVSDKLVMEHARTNLTERWGLGNFPLEIGEFGDLPLARSQAFAPIGEASIGSITPGKGLSAAVNWSIQGRANMKTTLRCALVRQDGTQIAEASTMLVPANPLQKGKTRIRILKSAVRLVPMRAGDVFWKVSLLDIRGRMLAESTVEHRPVS